MEEKILCHIIIMREHKAVSDKKILKQIVSAYKWDKEKGPVICFCNLNAYEYLVRNNLDQLIYLDVISSNDDIDEEKAKELIGEGVEIEFYYPFQPPFVTDGELEVEMDALPENMAQICRETMATELYLSTI
jgi:hypothetical protein